VFLRALGIDELGHVAARTMAQHFSSLDKCRDLTAEDLCAIDGFGEKMAASIVSGINDHAHLIDDLLSCVSVADHAQTAPQSHNVDHPLFGKSMVFTGKMSIMDRGSAQQRLRDVGGLTPSSVSGKLNFLVIGDEGSALLGEGRMSSKHKKAEKLIASGVEINIISESEFIELLGTQDPNE